MAMIVPRCRPEPCFIGPETYRDPPDGRRPGGGGGPCRRSRGDAHMKPLHPRPTAGSSISGTKKDKVSVGAQSRPHPRRGVSGPAAPRTRAPAGTANRPAPQTGREPAISRNRA